MKVIYILLLVMLMGCTNSGPSLITGKREVGKTYWIKRYKNSSVQIDSLLFKQISDLNVGDASFVIRPREYYFYLDGEKEVKVDMETYEGLKEGEYYNP